MEQPDGGQPRYAVIFVSKLRPSSEGYAAVAEEMVALVQQQPGFLGFDSVRGDDGVGITVSYWESLAAIEAWRHQPPHLRAQQQGREAFYESFSVHVTRIERSRRYSAL